MADRKHSMETLRLKMVELRVTFVLLGIFLYILPAAIADQAGNISSMAKTDMLMNVVNNSTNNVTLHSMEEHEKSVGKYSNFISEILPAQWENICKAEFKFVSGSNFTGQRAVYVSCDLDDHDYWSLKDYRQWISTNEDQIYKYLPIRTGLLFAFKFQCKNRQGRLSLPWPIRAKYLWYVAADDCTIVDHLLEFDVTHTTKDYIKVIEMTNCDTETNPEQLFKTLQYIGNVSRDYDCGGEVAERLVERNVTKTFSKTEDPKKINVRDFPKEQIIPQNHHLADMNKPMSAFNKENTGKEAKLNNFREPAEEPKIQKAETETQMLNTIAKFGQDNQKILHQCTYNYMKYMDESQLRSRAKHHSHFLLERSRYPALEYYNLSHSLLDYMSVQMLEWRRYFPKMKYLDLSHNRIKYFSTLSDNGLTSDPKGVLDLRYNNITTLTPEDLTTLQVHSRTVFVDIRDNPLICDCKLTHFVEQLKNSSFELASKYSYLHNMSCDSPYHLKGKKLESLENDFCSALKTLHLIAPIILLSCFIVLLVVIFVLTVRYRKEIMILAFTRLHISLPCRQVVKNIDKKYDAFIAYSEQDGTWVFKTLMPKLEETVENNGPGLKLCIHHRDFPVGRCISDNILDTVQESRHTVLILSNHFLRSHWCKYEFKTAFTQSLVEKKQHLIMVLKEELDKQLIDVDLKRCLKTFTYVKVDDRLFWDKIIYALSDAENKRNNYKFNRINDQNIHVDGPHPNAENHVENGDIQHNFDYHNEAYEHNENDNIGDEGVRDRNQSLVWKVDENHKPFPKPNDRNQLPIINNRNNVEMNNRNNVEMNNRNVAEINEVDDGFVEDGLWHV